MSPKIEDLLSEMIEYKTKPSQPGIYILKAFQNQGFEDLIDCIGTLLQWQKYIALDYDFDDHFGKDSCKVGEVESKRFQTFFHYCPELSDLFTLEEDKITFNSSLTSLERQEIWEFVHANFQLTRRVRRRRD